MITVVDTLVVPGIDVLEVILVVSPFIPVEVLTIELVVGGIITVLLDVLVITVLEKILDDPEEDCVLVLEGMDVLEVITLVSPPLPVELLTLVPVLPGTVTMLLVVLVITVVIVVSVTPLDVP